MRFVLIAAFLIAGLSQAEAQAQSQCPLGPKDTTLTIQRVMINFGKFTMKAESTTRDGAAATDAQIAEAVSDLSIAAACAQAVVDGTTPELMPSKAQDLTGADRDQYIAQFKQAMSGFRSALESFAAALTKRDFADAEVQKKLMNDLADQAHSHF